MNPFMVGFGITCVVLIMLARQIRFESLRTALLFFSLIACFCYSRINLQRLTDVIFIFLSMIFFISFAEAVVGSLLGDREKVSFLGGLARVTLSVYLALNLYKLLLCADSIFEFRLLALMFSLGHVCVLLRMQYVMAAERKLKVEGKGAF